MLQTVVLLIVLIVLNATFASAEIAVISMNETKLKTMAEEGNGKALKLTRLTAQPARFLATIQVAITMAGLLQSAVAADKFAGPLVEALIGVGVPVPEAILKGVSVFVITLVLAYFNLVFGELVPKRIAMKKADSLALGMAGLLDFVSRVFAPLVWLLTASTNFILRLLRMNPEEEDETVSEEEIRMMLVEGNKKGVIDAEENEMIQNVFEFNDISAEEICTHRRDVVTLYTEDTDEEWEQTILDGHHTKYPVCGENQDDVLGVLDIKRYLRAQDRSRDYLMRHVVDKAFFIPENMKANVVFQKMKESRTHFAVVIDEYGGMSGIVTMHDLIETLVGDLEEKGEPPKPVDILQISEDTWRILGCADLEEVEEAVGAHLPTDTFDTFNGYLCSVIGRVPDDGEAFTCEADGLHMDVQNVSGHMVEEVIVVKIPEEPKEEE